MKKIIYIAGPISNEDPETQKANLEHFHFNSEYLHLDGFSVLNPAMLPSGLTQEQYMSICLPMVMAATHVYMLKGWDDSLGAVAEFKLAAKLNKIILFEGVK